MLTLIFPYFFVLRSISVLSTNEGKFEIETFFTFLFSHSATILINPPILVLDDSTSSVDAATETNIQEAMANVMKGRTTLIVAHKLSSIQHADKVIVLEKGEILEIGTPQKLLEQQGEFSKIVEMQKSPVAKDLLMKTSDREQI